MPTNLSVRASRDMVRLDELDETVAPAQLQLHASPVTAVPGLWLASRDACATPAAATQLASAGVSSILVFGPKEGRWVVDEDVFGGDGRVHVYARATNGALITNLKDACDFLARALPGGVACVSDERGDDGDASGGGDGEPGAAFVCAAYMIVAKGMGAQEAACGGDEQAGMRLRAHDEFMKNLRFLQRNGIPDWA